MFEKKEKEDEKPSLFKSIKSQPDFDELLNQLPEDQKKIVLDYMNNLTNDFENNILKPLEKSLEDISKWSVFNPYATSKWQ